MFYQLCHLRIVLGQLSERRSIACDESVMSIWWTYDEHVMHGPPGQPRPPSTAVGRQARPRPEFPCKAQAGAKIRQSQRQLFQIHNISYYIIISWYPYHMPSRDAQQRNKYQPALHLLQSPELLMSQPLRLCWHVFQYRPWCCFFGLAKIYGLFFWEWIDMDCLFDLVCMDLYGSVWCLTRTLLGRTVKHQGQPIQRSAIVQTCHFNFCQSSDGWGSRCWWYWPLSSWYRCRAGPGCDTLWVSLGIPSASVEGLWRVMKGWNAGWATLNTSCYSAPFCSGSTLHTWNRLLFKMCPESKRRFCRFWWRRVFLTSGSVHRGLFFEI